MTGALRAVPWALQLARLRPDAAIDLQGLLRSALMGSLARPGRHLGLADAREGARWFYDETSPIVPGEHSVRRYLRCLEMLGIPPVRHPLFHLPPGEEPAVPQDFRRFILIHPFARGHGKSLAEDHVRELCRELDPHRVILAGTGRIAGAMPPNTLDLLNRTSLAQLIGLLRGATFVVSVDSGPAHIAAAVNPKLLSIHTWSDPRLIGPFNEAAWIWQGGEIRRQQLDGPPPPAGRPPALEDIQAIARFVESQLEG